MAKSALRRHHVARLKKKRKGYWGRDRGGSFYHVPLSREQLGKVVRTPKWCGCFMCSAHKRAERGLSTFYDVRLEAKAAQEMRDYDN